MKAKLLACLLCVFLMTSCNNKNKNQLSTDIIQNPNTASGKVSDKLPVFSFKEDTHNFGRVIEGEKVSFAFEFTNTGKSDLVIQTASASCGCTVADYPKNPIHPGGNGMIQVAFNSEGKKGIQTKTVTLMANTQPNTKVLTIKAEVYSPVSK